MNQGPQAGPAPLGGATTIMAHQEQSSPGKACGATAGKAIKINMLATATAKTTSEDEELVPESTTRANKEENPSKVTGSFLCKEKEVHVQLQYQYEENEIIWNLFDTTSDDDNGDEARINISHGDDHRTRQHLPGITGQNGCVGTS